MMELEPRATQPVIDLTAAARHFRKIGAHKPFVNAVIRMNDAFSAGVDLQSARRLFDAGAQLIAGDIPIFGEAVQDGSTASLAGAAFSYTIMIYVRIVTKSDDRGRVPLEEGATDEIKSAHARILKLRNTGIGHFGYALDHPGGAIAQDRVLIFQGENGAYVSHDYKRSNYRQKNLVDLEAVLRHGEIAIISIIERRRAHLEAELAKLDQAALGFVQSCVSTALKQDGFETILTPSGAGKF